MDADRSLQTPPRQIPAMDRPPLPDRQASQPVREAIATESPELSSRGRSTNTGRTTATTAGSSTLLDGIWSRGSGISALNREALLPLSPPSPLSHLRSRLRHRVAKSASSQTSISSQPVLVRAYTGSRPASRAPSTHSASIPVMGADAKLPPLEAFSFDGILRAVEPDIQDALDAIAEICARSRMSLANEHSAHMPPQGEILANGMPSPSPRLRQHGLAIRTTGLENPLTAVPEASSSSERLAGGSKASSRSGNNNNAKVTAYGSLKSIISRSLSHDQTAGTGRARAGLHQRRASAWAVLDGATARAAIVLTGPAEASNQLSLEPGSTEVPSALDASAERGRGDAAAAATAAGRAPVAPQLANGNVPASSSSSWLVWRHHRIPTVATASIERPRVDAEDALKDLLRGRGADHG